jgi:hypothetical protein
VQSIVVSFSGTDCEGEHQDGLLWLVRQDDEVLAWGQQGAMELRFDAGDLFWTDASLDVLKRLELAGGATTTLAVRVEGLNGLALSGGRVLWSDAVGDSAEGCVGPGVLWALVAADKQGGNVRELTEAPGCGVIPGVLAANSTDAYWVTSSSGFNTQQILKVPLDGGVPTTVHTVESRRIRAIALDVDHLYWVESNEPESVDVKRCPLASCEPGAAETIHTTLSAGMYGNMALTADRVVFGMRRYALAGDVIVSVPKSGGDATDVATLSSLALAVATDSSSVYWLDESSLNRVALSGGPVTRLVQGLVEPASLVIDGDRVVWTEARWSSPGVVGTVPVSGGAVTLLVDDAASPRYLVRAADGTMIYAEAGGVAGAGNGPASDLSMHGSYAYWLEGLGDLLRVPVTGGSVSTLAKVGLAETLIVDDLYAYALDRGGLLRIPVAGGVPVSIGWGGSLGWAALDQDVERVYVLTVGGIQAILKSGEGQATVARYLMQDESLRGGVAVGPVDVYWAETGFGAIKRKAK